MDHHAFLFLAVHFLVGGDKVNDGGCFSGAGRAVEEKVREVAGVEDVV